MSKIILFGKEIFVDKEDVDLLQDSVWHLDKDNYVVRSKRNAPKGFHYRLHRLILDAPPGKLVDHIDGNPLNNRRSNLRITDKKINSYNRKKLNINNTSGYRGVRKIGNRYYAYIKEDGRQRGLGGYATAKEASVVYEQELAKLDPIGCTNES
tara:strand:- start:146 stop:604 length:459 start_codon:yes stop_codon:yes gene_type:complete